MGETIMTMQMNEPFFAGHFPGRPVMPGVLMVEALAQAAAIMAYKNTGLTPENTLFLLAAVDKVRYRHMVVPGDQLLLDVRLLGKRQNFWKVAGTISVEGKEVCSAQMMSARWDLNSHD
jgi:3-hydroxyacyl-[acyl-carrier-protein] dehydratase